MTSPPSYHDSTAPREDPRTPRGDQEELDDGYGDLRGRILAVHDEHEALHKEVTPLVALPSLVERTQEELYTLSGKLTSLRTAKKRLAAQSQSAHKKYKKLKPAFGEKAMLPGRRKKWNAARQAWETIVAEVVQNDADIVDMDQRVRETKDAIEDAKAGCESLAILEKQLDTLDAQLFDGPTPAFPSEDSLEAMCLVLGGTAKLVQAESEREARARQKLLKSLAPLQVVLTQMKEALAVTLDAGVPTDTKYTKQLLTNGSALTVTRKVRPYMLRAKTESGKGHTLFAEARGSQLLVRELPPLTLLDLRKLPNAASGIDLAHSASERDIHASLEVAYNQSSQQVTHVKREIERSRCRTKFFKDRISTIRQEETKVRGILRAKRRDIVRLVVSGGRAVERTDGAFNDQVLINDPVFDFGNEEESQQAESVLAQAAMAQASQDTDERSSADEEGMLEFKKDAAGNPVAHGSTSSQLDPASTSMVNTSAAAAAAVVGDGTEELLSIPNPHLASSISNDSQGHLHPAKIQLKATQALRKIMKECVRQVNSFGVDDELPGYAYMMS